MSRIIILTIAAIILAISFIPTATAPLWYGSGNDTGLVGKWSCEGNFKDSSGQGNDGTQIGGVTITKGVKGRSCGFDGVDAYLTGNSVKLPNIGNAGNATITAWVKPYDITGVAGKTIFNKGSSGACFNYGMTLSGGVLRARANSDYTLGGNLNNSLGIWTHLAVVFNASGAYGYVNGVFVGNRSSATTTTCDTLNWVIGTRAYNSITELWNGTIDEVRIYNRSLSASEISALYNTTKTYKIVMKTTPTQGILDESGLVGYWKMDKETGSNSISAADSSGQGNIGWTVGGTIFTNEGKFKEAYSFDGVNDYLNVGWTQSINITGNVTFSAWIKPIAFGGVSPLFDKISTGGYYVDLFNTGYTEWVTMGTSDTTLHMGSGNLTLNTWQLVTFTYDGATKAIYVNGELRASEPATGSITPDNSQGLYLGARTGGIRYNGSIDEARLYNRSLSASEVAALYNGTKSNYIRFKTTPDLGILNETPAPTGSNETGLVGYWKMDDYVNGNTTDSHIADGTENNGSVIGATQTNAGRWNNGYSFDGVNDYINAGNANSLNITQNLTVSFWAKANSLEVYDAPLGRTNGLWSTGWGFFVRPATSIMTFFINTYSTTYATVSFNDTTTWHHFVGTYNGTHIRIFKDGVEGTALAYTSTITSTGNPILEIGSNKVSGTTQNWNGFIDEVRIYNRTLSADEVKELYLSKGLVGYWKMNDDQRNATNTFDSSGYYNHGLITGATLTNEGRFKEGYKFDGVNDYINFGYPTNWSGAHTYSGWVKRNAQRGYDCILCDYDDTNKDGCLFREASGTGIELNCGNGTGVIASTRYTISNNIWYHFVGTVNTTSICLYTNGALTGCNSFGGIPRYSGYDKLYAGDNSHWVGSNWNGTIDEVRIYNRALTASEIGGLYNGTKTNFIQFYTVAG